MANTKSNLISTTKYMSGMTKEVFTVDSKEFPKEDRFVKIILRSSKEAEQAAEKGFLIYEEVTSFPDGNQRIIFYIQMPFSEIISR